MNHLGARAVRVTPRGRGAVATIAIRGDLQAVNPCLAAVNGIPLERQPVGAIRLGRWTFGALPAEEVVFCRINEEEAEIHCHGGEAAVERILSDLRTCGVKTDDGAKQSMSVDHSIGDSGLTALTLAPTERSALLLLEQWQRFPEVFLQLDSMPRELRQARIADMLRWKQFGLHLTQPWHVALLGRPNVGKSSLMNALLGYERSVVFDQPGTTRDVLTAMTAIDGWPVEFLDTAGQREQAAESLEREGIQRARAATESVDLALLVYDASAGWTADDTAVAASLSRPLIVANKIDLLDSAVTLAPVPTAAISAKTRIGLDALMQQIIQRLIPEIPPIEAVYPVTAEQIGLLEEMQRTS